MEIRLARAADGTYAIKKAEVVSIDTAKKRKKGAGTANKKPDKPTK